MKIIKHRINIKINMLRHSNINHTPRIHEPITTHMLYHNNMLHHIMMLINIMFRRLIITTSKTIKILSKILQQVINIKAQIKFFIVKFFYFLAFFNLVILSSCASDKYDNDTLYNSVGFDQGSVPMSGQSQQKIAPDYFYRQAQGGMGGGMPQGGAPQYPQQQPYQMQQPYQPPQQYYPPTYGSAPYQVYPNAGSRFYSNPYAIPPSPYYPQYDVDQYYVPPTYSYGMEQSGAPSNRNTNSSR